MTDPTRRDMAGAAAAVLLAAVAAAYLAFNVCLRRHRPVAGVRRRPDQGGVPMTAGHDLRRVDEPATELDALPDVIVQTVILVRHADSGTARPVDVDRLRAAVEAGIDSSRRTSWSNAPT